MWGYGEAVGQRHRPAGVVPLVNAVGRRGFVLSADWLVRAAGNGVGQGDRRGLGVGRVVAGGQLSARGFRHTAATQGGNATAVAAGQHRGVRNQAGRLALSG